MRNMILETQGDRQLPTRVTQACGRCQRNKSRCDPFRPCSLCIRANVECLPSTTKSNNRAPKRRRTRGPSEGLSQSSQQGSVSDAIYQTPFLPEEQDAAIRDPPGTATNTDVGVIVDTESRRPSVADGEADSAMGIAQKICQLSSQSTLKRTTSAIPGGDSYAKNLACRPDRTRKCPLSSILGYSLPSVDMMCLLLEEYFDSVHWFSLVVFEPRFRSKFESLRDGLAYQSQKPFLLLLSTVIGMGAWYKSYKSRSDADYPDADWRDWALSLMQGAESRLADLMDDSSIASVQACILLGSYYVYHGKPNLSFALLGATIKTAQAIGLHRQPLRGDFGSIEERKRVWWTIYTWDRFASVTYGRPLGINDKDCNVEQPLDVHESPCFKEINPMGHNCRILYSSYQRELNKLYLIASTIIKTIFGIRTVGSIKKVAGHEYVSHIMEVTDQLWGWQRRLPSHLLLDLSSDCEPNPSTSSRVHRLQALSLQLTFDNLLIIIHRPFLAQQVDRLFKIRSENGRGAVPSPSDLSSAAASSPHYTASTDSPLSKSQMSSTEQWWHASLRTSKVTEMPQLAQLASESHLVAFMAINLFNSAIVLAVLALSDPLSDRAQEVKRTITRIFRLQELLGKRTTLSVQSNIVLKDIIHMVSRREVDAMLAPIVPSETHAAGDSDSTLVQPDALLMSVEDTLRLPVQLPLEPTKITPDNHQYNLADRALRLNESLASVQTAFPIGFDASHGDNTASTEGWTQAQGVPSPLPGDHDGSWLHTSFQGVNIDHDSEWADEDNHLDTAGNGLYWFWDSTWSETRT
ncbi:hypothetical protein K458DRAFT_51601 [Lentithecium fluviatile CBS 122367]|uniref:Zn(2)-C6 fungal-type domain-containing protein n=1 Tax=Lentithecium fluviatile CBS 122367 TaxID=1168545 RepID=A0A6G1IYH4_9PLEO|nr:hypothetical protein K458DRAFT_51601 [Lentithecium fluviatile CBS 122367]